MAVVFEEQKVEKLTLDAELALRRARRMLEWLRVIYENEARILKQSSGSDGKNSSRQVAA
jgi:hypothetical protein